MIDPDLRLTDLDRRHWENGWRLVVPRRAWGARAWALAVVEDAAGGAGPPALHRVILGGPAGQGQLDLAPIPWRGVERTDLEQLARALGVPAVIVVEKSALRELSRTLEPQLDAHQDLFAQGLLALRAIKPMLGARLWTHPPVLDLLPTPSYENVQRTFDLLVPDDTSMLFYVIEDDRQKLHTSLLIRKRRGHVDTISTHRALRHDLAEEDLARSWKTSYPRVLAAAGARLARPSLGLFLEHATLQRILTGPGDQLSRELSAKRVILDPAPAWLLGLLGGATVAAVAGRGARVLASMLPQAARQRASGLAQRAALAMKETGVHPFALLGFDPLHLLTQLQQFYRP
ncbi:MAG: hypothetical protein R3B48_14270 [Kofleriaceae bacterium]